jgi:hypothetical protein
MSYLFGISEAFQKLRLPLSNFKKNKTIDTPKIVNILINVSTMFQSSSGMTLLKNTKIYNILYLQVKWIKLRAN